MVKDWTRRRRAVAGVLAGTLGLTALALGAPPAAADTSTVCATGCDFTTIQAAIDDAGTETGDVIDVGAGTYDEDVTVNKSITLSGAGIGESIIEGPIGGQSTGVLIQANDVTVEGFTITREGNNTADWYNPGLNSAGLAIQGLAVTNAVIQENQFDGNRTGIDINNSGGHTITNNVISNNRTGLIFRNQTDDLTVENNFIEDNWTVGIVFLDASGGSNVPVQTAANSVFSANSIDGNWYGDVVDRQSGGSLPAPGSNLKDFSGNWWGTSDPVITTANSAEPGYGSSGNENIPTQYGGTATPPGGAPDVAGPASANIDLTPLLTSGTDTDEGAAGFQPGYSGVRVTNAGAQVGSTSRLQEGVDLVDAGGTVGVDDGTYSVSTPVSIAKSLTLAGPNAGISPNNPSNPVNTNPDRVAEATLAAAGGNSILLIGAPDVTVDGLRFTDPETAGASNTTLIGAGANFGGAAPGVTVVNNRFDGVSRVAVYFNGPTSMDGGTVTDNRVNDPTRADGCGEGPLASGSCGHQLFNLWQTDHLSFERNVVLDLPGNGDRARVLNVNFPNGPSLQDDSPATNITIADNTIRNSCTFTCFSLNAGVTNAVVHSNDVVLDVGNAVQLGGTWTTGVVDVHHNEFTNPADFMVVIDNLTADLDGLSVNRNAFLGGGVRNGDGTTSGAETVDATCNWWGSDSGPIEEQNFGLVDTRPWLRSADLEGECVGFGDIQGTISDSAGSGLEGLTVTLFADGGPAVSETTTAADGTYLFSGVDAGDYQVRVSDPAGIYETKWKGGLTRGEATTINLNDEETEVVNINTRAAGSVFGKVKNQDGAPLTGIKVRLYKGKSEEAMVVRTTAADGTYSIEGLFPANYRVQFVDKTGEYQKSWFGGDTRETSTKIELDPSEDFRANKVLKRS